MNALSAMTFGQKLESTREIMSNSKSNPNPKMKFKFAGQEDCRTIQADLLRESEATKLSVKGVAERLFQNVSQDNLYFLKKV